MPGGRTRGRLTSHRKLQKRRKKVFIPLEGNEPQLFKTAQDNCHKWKKVKASNNKGTFVAFYADYL